ncbi:dynein axonemal intermediate chain 3-like [Colletes gigas]|uniref:dynein axonemal intermediate chain 3-like n=1 Tax=Colletes gigas TaxID=935657 RepID=UPI001C9A34A7|nr:dynein axonemal intermediate chain 3-like [Colletes gigas]
MLESVQGVSTGATAKERAMPRRRDKRPLSWTLVAENIENVERVKLDPETQRELGCLVGEDVFLEYPWAYANRDVVVRVVKRLESPLTAFKEKIYAYESNAFLVGYASTRLISDDFVICLTEEAKRAVEARNKMITSAISSRVLDKILKTARPWISSGSESEVDEIVARNTRELFEIEIILPGGSLGSARCLSDRDSSGCRDSYAELVKANEEYENIDRKCVSRAAQTHSQPRGAFVQTYPGHPKNAWTQYAYEDALTGQVEANEEPQDGGETNDEELERTDDERSKGRSDALDEESDDEPREKTPLELFLEARSPEMIDAVKYNAAVNVHVDDIENLSRGKRSIGTPAEAAAFREQLSFADSNKAISDVSLPAGSVDRAAISYVNENRSAVLVWKFDDPLRPLHRLRHRREIHSVAFCPFDANLVIGGCSSGRVIVWNTRDHNEEINIEIPAVAVSDASCSHRLPVRRIQWMPAKYKIEPNGKLTESSVAAGRQFLTASEDSTVAVWNLDDKVPEDAFQPILRLRIPGANGEPGRLTCMQLPSGGVLWNQGESSRITSNPSLWIGCADGLIRCTWDEQMFDEGTVNAVECRILGRSCMHDGPVTEITRSPHLEDVILTIGGRVFAVWKDDCLERALFWRRTCCSYTACCWASEPGVFVLAGERGVLELWDIKNESSQAIVSQTVSSKSITRLLSFNYAMAGQLFQTIGVADEGGFFRAFSEPENLRGDSTIERMDWFEEYVWRETRRKKVFASWQNDFLANDPAMIAKRSARRDEERKKELDEARERLRREQKERSRSKAEKRTLGAPRPKDVAWSSREHDRMRSVLLGKKNLVPSELEAKRLPLVLREEERDTKLSKARDETARWETYFSRALTEEFPEIPKSKNEASKPEEPTIKLATSVDDCLRKYDEIRSRAREMLTNNFTDSS